MGTALLIGKSLWATYCSSCHGENGAPNVPGVPNIALGEGAGLSNRERLKAIRNGGEIMPPFNNRLSDDDVDNIVTYMITLYPESSRPTLGISDPNLM